MYLLVKNAPLMSHDPQEMCINNIGYLDTKYEPCTLTLSQTTNTRLFQKERVCR